MRRTMILGAVLLVVFPLVAADWESWRGPGGNGVSEERLKGVRSLSPDRVMWRADVGFGHSAVSVRGDRVFTMGNRQAGGGWEDVVFCLDTRTGREIWRYAYPCPDKRWPGPGSTPVLDGDRLYTLSWQGELYCFDAATGAVRWRRHLVDMELAEVPEWGFCASPVVIGGVLVINAGRSGIGLDPKTGAVKWASEAGAGGLSTPVVLPGTGSTVAAIIGRRDMVAVEVTTGEVLWTFEHSSYTDPVVVGDRVLLTAGDRPGKRGIALIRLTADGPVEIWRNAGNDHAFQSWVVIGDHAYGFTRNRSDALTCLDLNTGEVRWSQDYGDWGSLSAAADTLIVIRGDGELVLVEPTGDSHQARARARIFSFQHWRSYPNGRPDTVWTAPVLAGGKLYVRSTHGQLACVALAG